MKDNISIVFVILHYNTLPETVNCVESIRNNIDTQSFHIVVVDNCSTNNSCCELKKRYNAQPRITILSNETNLGFARGNNVGIRYAVDVLGAKFVCCMNNDTLLKQLDFFAVLQHVYDIDRPAVIGPKVILKDGSVQKIRPYLLSSSEYNNHFKAYKMILNNSKRQKLKEYLLRNKFIKMLNNVKHGLSDTVKVEDDNFYDVKHTDILLHGCCWIFTPSFFSVLGGLCEETFLYYEEELLFLDLMNAGLHNMYCPELVVYHLEDAATNSITANDYEKKLFVTGHKLNSVKVLLDHLKKTIFDIPKEKL